MDNFKQATKEKLRFQTNKGLITTEQLWDLSLTDLDNLAVTLDKEYKESGKKSFLVKKSSKDKTTKLMFDIVVEILTTKVDAQQTAQELKDKKDFNDKIDQLIANKKEEKLQGLSISELESMRKL